VQVAGVLTARFPAGSGTAFLEERVGVSLAAQSDIPVLDFKDLYQSVQRAAGALLRNGHYDEAVGRAAKALHLMVRQKTGRTLDDGVGMMHQVFNANPTDSRRLHLTDLADQTKIDEQEGVRFLMAGMQAAIANVASTPSWAWTKRRMRWNCWRS
jgi:uncharacterized protein (TIGR02391 family)